MPVAEGVARVRPAIEAMLLLHELSSRVGHPSNAGNPRDEAKAVDEQSVWHHARGWLPSGIAALLQHVVQRGLAESILEIHIRAGFEQRPGRFEVAPLDREQERRLLATRVHDGPGANQQPDCGRAVVERRGPQAMLGIGAALEEEHGQFQVLPAADGIPQRRGFPFALGERLPVDIERGIEQDSRRLDAVSGAQAALLDVDAAAQVKQILACRPGT